MRKICRSYFQTGVGGVLQSQHQQILIILSRRSQHCSSFFMHASWYAWILSNSAQPAQIMKDFKELFWRVVVVTSDKPRRKGFIFPFLCSWISAHLSAFLSGSSHFLTVWHVRMFLKTQGPAKRWENMLWVLLWKEIIVNLLTAIEEAQRARLLTFSYTALWKK